MTRRSPVCVRLHEPTLMVIEHLMAMTGETQSQVIRHLLAIGVRSATLNPKAYRDERPVGV